jgi:hypothetical protein
MAAEELRKFFWRMGRLAPRSRSSKGGTVTYGTTELNWSAWFLAGTAGLLGAGWLCMRVYGPEKFYVRYWGSFLVASALTTYFLGLHWHQMVWSWCRRPGILTGLLQMGRWAPLVFIGLMWSFFIYLCVRQGSPPNSDGFIWFFFFGFTLLALGLRTLLGDIVHFMGAWRAFMRQPAPAQPGSVLEREPGAAGGGALASTLIYTGWSLLVAQSASTLLTLLPMLPMIFRSQLLEVLLGFGLYFLGLNTPLFVLLLMVRELLRDDAPGS